MLAQLAARELKRVDAGMQDLSAARPQQADHGAAERRFARAGFADHAERLARPYREADIDHRLDPDVPSATGVGHVEMVDGQDGIVRCRIHEAAPASVNSPKRRQRTWRASLLSTRPCGSRQGGST